MGGFFKIAQLISKDLEPKWHSRDLCGNARTVCAYVVSVTIIALVTLVCMYAIFQQATEQRHPQAE